MRVIILERMKVLSTKYTSEAFEDNDSLKLAYGVLIFNACRETCLPLYFAHRGLDLLAHVPVAPIPVLPFYSFQTLNCS